MNVDTKLIIQTLVTGTFSNKLENEVLPLAFFFNKMCTKNYYL